MARRQIPLIAGFILFVTATLYLLQIDWRLDSFPPRTSWDSNPPPASTSSVFHEPPDPNAHPIEQLIDNAQREFAAVKARQSRSLKEAVAEYRRRYQIPPPPHFDKWYSFAKRRGVQLIDEYDSIHHSLLPFWALEPATIRARAREALGFDNALMGVSVRGGSIHLAQGGPEWLQEAITGMTKSFIAHLPDMDLAFNIHDEPRVVVPHDDLSRLVSRAQTHTMPLALSIPHPKNVFSVRPPDLNDGLSFPEVKTTRFNRYAHQPTWTVSKQSCPPSSPARSLEDHPTDNLTAYAVHDLGFVYNVTAFSDVCLSPSFRQTYGFFDRPNAFDVTHDLFPIFSQSKVSSFQDILYPSPWYWSTKVPYDESRDHAWDVKNKTMYWRGSTTGGFSRDGGWRRQHRQRFVKAVNAPDSCKTLSQSGGSGEWQTQTSPRRDFAHLFDVHFSHVGQCDPQDCDAQREFFAIAEPADQQDAWGARHLLDMDGNAFSGRFYAFLRSRSLVYKLAVFREWHSDWLWGWVHYVPLSLGGGEVTEAVRWFEEGKDDGDEGPGQGQRRAKQVADAGREWAEKVLRKEDFEVVLFRVLLEYARVVDDNREIIGYGGGAAAPAHEAVGST